jgi:mono/diheme cytochrome c family protein
VLGLTGILVALIVLTVALAGVFLVRSSITTGPLGKILAFAGLCVLPGLCIGGGMSFHLQRSQQTRYCISCHSMASHGRSLYLLNPQYIPAQHFQNHFVPSTQACYACHTDYTMFGPWKDRLKGLLYVYMEYIGTPPKPIHLIGAYNNQQCLRCHAGTRDFEDHLAQMPPLAALVSNRISCISSGCHDMIHNASRVNRLAMWTGGATLHSLVSGLLLTTATTPGASPRPAPATPKAAAAAKPAHAAATASPAAAGGSGGAGRATAQGKSLFVAQRCASCHGAAGGGGTGPALTHIAAQDSPAKLAALLKAPTAAMRAAGMTPLALPAAKLKALVAYVSSLGKHPATASAAAAPAARPPRQKPAAAAAPAVAVPAGTGTIVIPLELHISISAAAAAPVPARAASPGAKPTPKPTGKPVTAATGSAAGASTPSVASPAGTGSAASRGQSLFASRHCSSCHGATGGGGTGPPLTHIASQDPPAKLTALLQAPTAGMKLGGMTPLTLSAADMKALVAYVSGLGGKPAAAVTPAHPAMTQLEAAGKLVFAARGCANCHGPAGAGGTAAATALAGTGSALTPGLISTMLQHPTARMRLGGMPLVSLSASDRRALAAYVSSLSASRRPKH